MNKLKLFIIIMSFYQYSYATEFKYQLSAEQWAVPRSVSSILAMPAVSSTMKTMQKYDGSSLVIYHPGGDVGSLWATELRGWLISLGLPESKIKLVPGSSDSSQLDLEIFIQDKSSTLISN